MYAGVVDSDLDTPDFGALPKLEKELRLGQPPSSDNDGQPKRKRRRGGRRVRSRLAAKRGENARRLRAEREALESASAQVTA